MSKFTEVELNSKNVHTFSFFQVNAHVMIPFELIDLAANYRLFKCDQTLNPVDRQVDRDTIITVQESGVCSRKVGKDDSVRGV